MCVILTIIAHASFSLPDCCIVIAAVFPSQEITDTFKWYVVEKFVAGSFCGFCNFLYRHKNFMPNNLHRRHDNFIGQPRATTNVL